jgi:hypothetical protein
MKLPQAVRTKIKQNLLNHFRSFEAERNVNLYLYDEILSTGEKLRAFSQEIYLSRDTAFVLADLAPQYNWAHPCQWCLHNARTGDLEVKIDSSFPPSQIIQNPESLELFHSPIQLIDTRARRAGWEVKTKSQLNVLSDHRGERYAILFSGSSNNRHVNDIEFLYRTLIDIYGFNPANIYVLNFDGTINYNRFPKPVKKWPGDDTAYRMVVNGKGTRDAFQATLAKLATQIHPEDLLFIHTNDHGAGPGDGVNDYCLCTYDTSNWVAYYVNDFVSDLSVLPEFDVLIVMMEQCRSGGFINPIINNTPARWTHVATAVQASDYSLGGGIFDPFAEDWIAAIAGQYPDGSGLAHVVDTNNDGRISAAEAFAYADAVHHTGDTPTFAETPSGAGTWVFKGGENMELYFYPEKPEEVTRTFERGKIEEARLFKLTEIVKKLKDDIEESGSPKWEVTLKGYIEASSGGILPGGKTGFEATIKLSSP